MKLNLKFKIRNKVNKVSDFSRITHMKRTQIVERATNIGHSRQSVISNNQKTNINENKTKTLELNGKLKDFNYNRVYSESSFTSKHWNN